jgi:hypothetical protein
MFFKAICWSPICVNWAIAEMNYKSFLMRRPSSSKNCLFKWNEYACHKIVAVHFGIIWESDSNIEVARVPHDCKHEFFALNIKSRLCDHIPSIASISDVVMYRRKTTTHHQSQNDVSHHVRQHARRAVWPEHIPSVFHANHASTDAAPNVNGTIWSQ